MNITLLVPPTILHTIIIYLSLQASASLPKTSYFKMVDVWLLSSIFFIFIIIVLHTVIDRVREWEPTSANPPAGTKKITLSRAPSEKSTASNTVHPSEEEKVTVGEPGGPPDVEETSNRLLRLVDMCLKHVTGTSPETEQRPLFEKIILGARVLVLGLLVVFNLVYWTVVLV